MCNCRRRAGARAAGATIKGFEYTPPGGTESRVFLTYLEAKQEQRRNGGGTIKQLTK